MVYLPRDFDRLRLVFYPVPGMPTLIRIKEKGRDFRDAASAASRTGRVAENLTMTKRFFRLLRIRRVAAFMAGIMGFIDAQFMRTRHAAVPLPSRSIRS
jgi:hypothetical protein